MNTRIFVSTAALFVTATAAAAHLIDRVDWENGARIQANPSFWRSGPLKCKLKVDPARRNYITVKLHGSDTSHDHLLMLVDGKAMGQMHLGTYDLLDYESCWPRDSDLKKADPEHMGAFTYRTFLLPDQAVAEKNEIDCEIWAVGHVWGYGKDFEQFQKPVLNDSRRIFAVLTHDTAFPPLTREDVKTEPVDTQAETYHKSVPPVDLERIREDVSRTISERLRPGDLLRHMDDIGLVAESYWIPGNPGYRNKSVPESVVAVMDDIAERFAKDRPKVIENGSWHGLKDVADGIWRLGGEVLATYLDRGGRRAKWADALEASCNQLFTERRFFANQCQIVDTSCHIVNRALKVCDPERGPSLETTTDHLREAMGIKPCPNGYVCLTRNGLSKEDGYVGSYGESTIWAAVDAYEATRGETAADGERADGDLGLLKQLHKAVLARSYFRFPGVRRDGSRVMRLENVISWRNDHFPGMPDYLSNGSCLLRPWALTRSAKMLGFLKDAMDDGWFQRFACGQGEKQMSMLDKLHFLKDYPKFTNALERAKAKNVELPHLPMLGDDFVWCDSENAVVALKYGKEILYVNAYYRARGSINHLARVHFIRPEIEVATTVFCDVEFEQAKDVGGEPKTLTVQDYFQYGWQGRLYDGYRASTDGDSAAWPPKNVRGGIVEPVGTRGGRADFYVVRYGPYIVAINDSDDGRPRKLSVPDGEWISLTNNGGAVAGAAIDIASKSCLVLRLAKGK